MEDVSLLTGLPIDLLECFEKEPTRMSAEQENLLREVYGFSKDVSEADMSPISGMLKSANVSEKDTAEVLAFARFLSASRKK